MSSFLGDAVGIEMPAFSQNGNINIVPAGASELIVSDLALSQGDQGMIEISLENEVAIAGFQFNIIDTPDILSFLEIEGTDRTENFQHTS